MDPEAKGYIKRTLELTEENNKILRKMHSAMIWGRAWRVFYWVLIIAISIGSLYFIQPYLDQLMNVYVGLQSDMNSIQKLKEYMPNLPK